MNAISSRVSKKVAAIAFAVSIAIPCSAGLYINFELTPFENPVDDSLDGFAGAVAWDDVPFPPGSSPLGWAVTELIYPGFSDLSPAASGNLIAYFEFTVTGSSGNNWDDVQAGGAYTFDLNWNGSVQGGTSYDIFFSHIGTAANSLGQWVLNNNSASTPGATVDPIWTVLEIDDLSNLTGSTGRFAVLADDSAGVMGFPSEDAGSVLINAGGTGSLTAQAVPEPSTYGILGGLILLGLIAHRRIRAKRS